MKIGAFSAIAGAALLASQMRRVASPVVVDHEPQPKDAKPEYEFKPKNIDPLAKPKSKRAMRRAEAKARAAKENTDD